MLKLTGIKKDYITASETVHALKGVDLCFRKNEFVSVLGPSGCGKTTLLNIIGGLDHYTDGDLVINGRSTKFYRDRDWDVYRNHRIGFIFQSYNLIPHQTILGNVELALTIAGIGKEERIARAKEALDKVGLAGQYYKRPNQLSGGQCQRVAIARALVNNPEILLADEPTGALDTVTSTQIMELVKEISKERLVIMVTHNPELAEEYSSRIIRLLDGLVIEDSNPFSPEDEAIEVAELAKLAAKEEAKEPEAPAKAKNKNKKKKSEKAKMSFFTAFKLSARNLISKKGRTTMVGIAGSIGIIGIACVLAFSAGIKGYIASMQDDMLSGNPITIQETAFDLSAITKMMDTGEKIDIIKQPNQVYISSVIEHLIKTSDTLDSMLVENEITKEYVDYFKAMPQEYYNALVLGYGLDLNKTVFTDFFETSESDGRHVSLKQVMDIYKAVLSDTDYKDLVSLIDRLAPNLEQAPANEQYIRNQYEIVAGELADEANEIMLVLDANDELSDLLLAKLGYFSQAELLEVIDKASAEDENGYNKALYREYFSYDELLGKTFTWYPTDSIFSTEEIIQTNPMTGEEKVVIKHNYKGELDSAAGEGTTLRVVGILTPNDNISYGVLSSGIYYTEALTEYILQTNAESDFVNYLIGDESKLAQILTGFTYDFDYVPYESMTDGVITGERATKDGESVFTFATRESIARNLGGYDLANSIKIYPLSFDDKDLVTQYLNQWNDEKLTLTVNGVEITPDMRQEVTYTDTLELVISMINTMIDVVSYALIAFTSISLVVSTVMIGIITYVSVVERIKEIGVIRSLGGRKRDVSALFNAETFIIGLLAGLIGVFATYGISVIVNLVLGPIINYSNIAALPVGNAVTLVILSVLLTSVSGLLPARSAARKDPVVALRTE